MGEQPFLPQAQGSRLACAANFGQNHSIAARFGGQNNFVGNLLGGNSVSGILNLGMMAFGNKTPTRGDIASVILSGGGQGMANNASTYSIGGVADKALGTNIMGNSVGRFLGGNGITGLYLAFAGSFGDAAQTMGGQTPGIIRMGMGSALTYGRRTSDIISLNIPGKGGLPQALSSASRGASSFLDDISSVFNLGMDATTRLAIDGGLFAIEAGVCAVKH